MKAVRSKWVNAASHPVLAFFATGGNCIKKQNWCVIKKGI